MPSDNATITIIVITIAIILLSAYFFYISVRVVNHAEVIIIERFGSYKETLMPGLHFVVPLVEQVRQIDWRYLSSSYSVAEIYNIRTERIDCREHVIDFGRQHVITMDTVQIDIDALVYFRIIDPRLAVFKIQNIPDAVEFVTQATLRNIIANMTLDDTFSSRDTINAELLLRVKPDVERWGVAITRVEIFNIIPPSDIKAAMELQIRAERTRRSEVLRADGERESRIVNSRGDAAKMVLAAEGERASVMLRAKGQAEAKLLESRAEAASMQAIRGALADSNVRAVDYLVAFQYLNLLHELTSRGGASEVVLLPVETFTGIEQIVKLNTSSATSVA